MRSQYVFEIYTGYAFGSKIILPVNCVCNIIAFKNTKALHFLLSHYQVTFILVQAQFDIHVKYISEHDTYKIPFLNTFII